MSAFLIRLRRLFTLHFSIVFLNLKWILYGLNFVCSSNASIMQAMVKLEMQTWIQEIRGFREETTLKKQLDASDN